MSANIIVQNASIARQAGFKVSINEMKPSLAIEAGSALYSFEGLDADDILDEAQDLADAYVDITQADVLLHFAMCWSNDLAA